MTVDKQTALVNTDDSGKTSKKSHYDHNRLGTYVFIGDNDRLKTLDDLYWSYVEEFVSTADPFLKLKYIKSKMRYASFNEVGTFKMLARADQDAKERIARL
jgi:hypothetical protein